MTCHRRRWRVGWLVAAVTLLGVAIRVAGLQSRSVWQDEMIALRWAALPVSEIPRALLENDSHPPLLYLMLHVWQPLTGSDLLLRLPSAMAGSLTVPVTYALGRRLAGTSVGVVAALLSALAPALVWQAQESRPYALLAVLVNVAALLMLDLHRPGYWRVLAYGAVAAAALWLHYGALFLIAGVASAGLLVTCHRRRVVEANLLAALLFAPWGLIIVGAILLVPATYTQSYLPTLPGVSGSARAVVAVVDPYVSAWPVWLRVLVLVLQSAVLGVGVWRLCRRARRFVGTWVGVTLGLGLLLATRYAVFWQAKVLLPLLPAVLIVVAAGLVGSWQALRGRPAAVAGGVVVLASLLPQLTAVFLPQPFDAWGTPLGPWSEDWRGVSAYLEGQGGPEARVLLGTAFLEVPFRRADPAPRVKVDAVPEDAVPAELGRVAGEGEFWLVTTSVPVPQMVAAGAYYDAGWRVVERRPFAGLLLTHYAPW